MRRSASVVAGLIISGLAVAAAAGLGWYGGTLAGTPGTRWVLLVAAESVSAALLIGAGHASSRWRVLSNCRAEVALSASVLVGILAVFWLGCVDLCLLPGGGSLVVGSVTIDRACGDARLIKGVEAVLFVLAGVVSWRAFEADRTQVPPTAEQDRTRVPPTAAGR